MSAETVMKAEISIKGCYIQAKITKPYEIAILRKQDDIAFNIGGWNINLYIHNRKIDSKTGCIITIECENDKNLKRVYVKSKKVIDNLAEYEYEDVYENIEERQITCETSIYRLSISYDRNAHNKYMDINAETD
ncbi:MAG: hypothetical protein JHC31_13965 [Sulfurihydrogenibium sp.]|jgi:hypothetical protein|nr:hypothetical protein [Sulfurihydrogenibium sp.]